MASLAVGLGLIFMGGYYWYNSDDNWNQQQKEIIHDINSQIVDYDRSKLRKTLPVDDPVTKDLRDQMRKIRQYTEAESDEEQVSDNESDDEF